MSTIPEIMKREGCSYREARRIQDGAGGEPAPEERTSPARCAVSTGSVQPSAAAKLHVQNWLWHGEQRETHGLPWTDEYVRDAARMIDAYVAAQNTEATDAQRSVS